jgi:hypothetical protein
MPPRFNNLTRALSFAVACDKYYVLTNLCLDQRDKNQENFVSNVLFTVNA